MKVAIPWALTHYIPLNGFHPLYQALFEFKPEAVTLAAWDNIELSQKLRGDKIFRKRILQEIEKDSTSLKLASGSIERRYFDHFWNANRALTRLLPGDIEFHHTAPFPSLERPFVFHCESFAPIFFPFAHQGTGPSDSWSELRAHYKKIFEHPLCIGIFSHLSGTLEDCSRFFNSPIIDGKLHKSRVGVYRVNREQSLMSHPNKGSLADPVFLFINSAHQRIGNFFLRGGHLVLQFWQQRCSELKSCPGRLIMRCARPPDGVLTQYGVDLDWLAQHENRNVFWIEGYLNPLELDNLLYAAHFFLLPSMSLHSVSIMSAMAAGAVPIISDTLGIDRYVEDDCDGIVLNGVYSNNWKRDPEAGVLVDQYKRNLDLEKLLLGQLVTRIETLLKDPEKYRHIQTAATKKASCEFSGQEFSTKFWSQVEQLYRSAPNSPSAVRPRDANLGESINGCLLDKSDWRRVFSSTPQPLIRLNVGSGSATELGGCFIAAANEGSTELHHWSPVAEYIGLTAPRLNFASSIKGLGGGFLSDAGGELEYGIFQRVATVIAEQLRGHPRLFSLGAHLYRKIDQAIRIFAQMNGARVKRKKHLNILPSMADVELYLENVKGLNIVRCGQHFYAISQDAGEFIPEKARSGGYNPCIFGASFKEVLRKIEETPEILVDNVELIEEGVRGFNIIRCGKVFYGIPQSEGAFEINRVISNGYSCVHSGEAAAIVRSSIQGVASD